MKPGEWWTDTDDQFIVYNVKSFLNTVFFLFFIIIEKRNDLSS